MYYHARYYDPSMGQFISADVAQGTNRYGYVAGNPETQTDPTGNFSANGIGEAIGSAVWGTPHDGGSGSGANTASDGSGATHLPTSCGTYTSQAQCDKAKDAQEAAVKDARKAAGVWQLLVGLATGAFDIMMLIRDLNSAKSDNPDKAVDIAKDIVGIVADLGVLLEGIGNAFAGLFGDSGFLQGLRQFGAKVVDVGNTARALLLAYQVSPGFFQTAGRWILAGGLFAMSLLTGQAQVVTGTIFSLADLAGKIVHADFSYVLQSGIIFIQNKATDQSTHAEDLESETPFGFCTSTAATSGCPTV